MIPINQNLSKRMTESFTHTSLEPYDRHQYKLVFQDGRTMIFDSYTEIQDIWYSAPPETLSHVEVIDRKNNVQPKGFK